MNIQDTINQVAGLTRPVVGLQVTPQAAHAVVLQKHDNKTRIRGCHALDFHAEGFLDEMDFAEHLPDWLNELGLQDADIILGVPQDVTTVQLLDFPPNSQESLDSMVSLQTSQLAELSDESFTYDYAIMPPSSEHPVPVLVGVCLETFIQDRLEHYNKPGVNLADLSMDSVGIVNACVALKLDLLKESRPQIILDMATESTTIVIMGEGRVLYAGWLNVGVANYQQALAEKHSVGLEQILNNPERYRITRKNNRDDDPLARVNRLFANELQAAFEQWADQVEEDVSSTSIIRTYITGNGSSLPRFSSFLEEVAKSEVEILKLQISSSASESAGAAYTAAYGLALQGLGTGLLSISLAPPELRWLAKRRHRTGAITAAAALLALLLVTTFFWNFARLKEQATTLKVQRRELVKCENIIDDLEQTLAQLRADEQIQIPIIEHGNRARKYAAAFAKLSEVRADDDWFIYLADRESFDAYKNAELPQSSVSGASNRASDRQRQPQNISLFGMRKEQQASPENKDIPKRTRPGRNVDDVKPLKSMVAAGFTKLRVDDPLKPVIDMVEKLNQTALFNNVDWLQASYLEGRQDIVRPWQQFLLQRRQKQPDTGRQYKDFALQMPFSELDIKTVPDKQE
ncbi:MAG: hypothetical protein R6V56_00840 [Lentisphaeria bacterium]